MKKETTTEAVKTAKAETAKTAKTETAKAVKAEATKAVEAAKPEDTAKATKPATKAKKTPAKKTTTEKKATTTKAAATKTELTSHVVIQTSYSEIVADDVITKALNAYKEEGNKTKVKNINVYIKPEENAAYYVINDKVAGKVDIF